MQKSTLRRILIQQRIQMSDHAARSLLLQNFLHDWLLQRNDLIVGAYWPIKNEFNPLPTLQAWQTRVTPHLNLPPSRKIALPAVDPNSQTLQYFEWFSGCPMTPDAYGIPTPQHTALVKPDLLLVPCVGYSAQGYRLGYGGGFYDRTLAQMQPQPTSVGLAFATSFIADFLAEPHDLPLSMVLTDAGVAWPR